MFKINGIYQTRNTSQIGKELRDKEWSQSENDGEAEKTMQDRDLAGCSDTRKTLSWVFSRNLEHLQPQETSAD